MKNIALITIWSVPNYGSVLQAYATQVTLEKLGHRCHIIDYKYPNEYHLKKTTQKRSVLFYLKEFLVKTFMLSSTGRIRNRLSKFINNNFHKTIKYNSYKELCNENWDKYDVIVVGSDQVWNYKFLLGDKAFLLGFTSDNVKKISIASSFGNSEISKEYYNTYKDLLSQFTAISVREQNGLEILKKLSINKNNAIILDPTLLLCPNDYDKLIDKMKPIKNYGRYILLYGQYYAFEPRPYIFDVCQYLSKRYDAKIIALEGMPSIEYSQKYNIIDKTGVSISDFLQLFKNAFIVVTSSFHGTAFAINYRKPLISITPNSEDDRQSSLMKQLGISKNIAYIKQNFEELDPFYDKIAVQERLNQLKTDSIRWISKHL